MYQFVGDINDTQVAGLDSLNYMNENLFSKDDPAINEHHYILLNDNITKRHITYTSYMKSTRIT